jgi:D-amino peptidase
MLGKEIQNFYLNGKPVGEMAINAAFAGQLGVPVAMVAGDHTLESEAKGLLGDVETVVLKKGLGRFTAQLIHPRITGERLQKGAKRAVQRAKQLKPYVVDSPSTIGIEFTSTAMADVCSWIPTVERTRPRSIEFTFADWREGMGLMLTLLWLSLHVADHMY